jgi:hypothetical protein
LHTDSPPFHDSPVAIGRHRFVEPSSRIGSVAGFPSSHTRHQFGRLEISSTATLWLSPTRTFCSSWTNCGSRPARVISAYTIVGVSGIEATPTCSHIVCPSAP